MTAAGAAEERVRRIVSLLFGVAALVFGLISLGAVLAQLDVEPGWWTVGALVAILGTSAALGIASLRAPLPALRGLAAAVAVGYALVAVSMPFVVRPDATAGAAPWPLGLTAVATTAAALAFRPAIAWGSTLVLGLSVVLDRITTGGVDLTAIALQDGAYATFFGAVFVGLTVGAIAAGRQVDGAASEADRAAIDAAVARAHEDERARVDALVHDRVLATLLLAARRVPGTEEAVQGSAAVALEAMEELRVAPAPQRAIALRALIARLRNEITLIAPWADVDDEGADDADVPIEVAEALLGAMGEALRNAALHAGAASIAVRIEGTGARVSVIVLDDGPGFDLRSVPLGRLGIASSIVGRMRRAGGDAIVRSKPGVGTAVQLVWTQR